jgi:poly(3-hydroxybutyrate) depolymerase
MRHWIRLCAALLLALLALPPPGQGQEALGRYPADPAQVSVSGISSGAFMANQLHVARSADIMGVALVAGGLYGCAVDSVAAQGVVAMASVATGPCMRVPSLLRSTDAYVQRMRDFAARGWIDPVEGLARARLYAFTGQADQVVNPEVVRRGVAIYGALGLPAAVFRNTDLPGRGAGHSWVTMNFGLACDANADPYINDCGYDQAGEILRTLYGDLAPRAERATGRTVAFDQKEFAPGGDAAPHGLWDTGYLYVPTACAPGAGGPACRLHIVLHGCRQSVQQVGDVFHTRIGMNEWADTNRILVLYPQARTVNAGDFRTPRPTDLFQINPEGCWNWWGYAYDTRYLFKDGAQVNAIWGMVQRVTGRGNR